MSNSEGDERIERRRRRRRRAQSARPAAGDISSEPKRYTKLLEDRLRKASLLPTANTAVVAMQTRHVNNHQHAIPFAQQFLDQLLEDCQCINRQIEAERRKQAEQTDKEKGRWLRQMESTFGKKIRELKLYNDRSLVKGLMEEYLKNSTPQGQLRRIQQLEENDAKLRQEHDQLLERLRQFEERYGQEQDKHNGDMNKIENQFNQYHAELKKYKSEIGKTNADLTEKLQALHDRQEQHASFIQDLFIQRDTLNTLSQHIKQIIDARRDDLEQLEKFTQSLERLKDRVKEIREGILPLDRIPSLEQDIVEIRNLLIEPSVMDDIELRIRQAQRDIGRHSEELEQLNEQLSNCQSSCQELNEALNYSKTSDLTKVLENLRSIERDLEMKSSQIDQSNAMARSALDQLDQLRHSLININEGFLDLQKKLDEMETSHDTRDQLITKSEHPDIAQLLEEQNQIRSQLRDLIEKQEQLSGWAGELDLLRQKMDHLDVHPVAPSQLDQETLRALLENAKREVMDLISPTLQQLNERMAEAGIFIGELKARLEQLLNAQQKPELTRPPLVVPMRISPQVKRIPYVESLSPLDLLNDTWK